MQQPLTPAAQRVLDRATEIATAGQSATVAPLHLLRSLLLEESRASEILGGFDVAISTVETVFPDEKSVPTAETTAESEQSKLVPMDEQAALAVQEARHLAGIQGRHSEVGTEHLLWGLLVVDSDVSTWLHEQGVQREQLTQLVDEKTGFSAEPLVTDVRIEFSQPSVSQRHNALRIIDAAANRAREGVRVVEDYVRFISDDAHLSTLLKSWRHDFTAAISTIAPHDLAAARDTLSDVGTTISTTAEAQRDSTAEVLQANLKRVQEAVRTLEEYGKVLAADLGGQFEQLRYRFYTLEKSILSTLHNQSRLAGRNLYLLVSEALCHHGSGPAIREALAGGVSIVQLREKEMPDRELVEFGRRVRQWTRETGALFIMNDRPDLAVLTDADGVHVGQEELSVKDARRIVGTEKLVGVSTHTIEQARQAVMEGADYIGVGPVFSSTTKQFTDLAGLEFVRQVAAEITLPWYAIGGITADNIAQVTEAGATRVAVSSAVCSMENSQTAAAQLMTALPNEP
ncbi:Thiamine-phosphate synthase [Symmachiella dynata]|uniref:Thiamine-phosphate synthase n=1 Tax=Symmachiella dynata TaxID=2527995 RepID=A0A517ZVB6_9PLAN|nr:thiamine phosphate synthase [Symmachiella dynata]QDU46419.1 Thiamine-phosphate synthase [Symmachiella dynata]